MESIQQGTIRKKTDKGYGFIAPEAGGRDVFFHANELQNAAFHEIEEGQKVEFGTAETDKGINAVNVTIID